MIDTPTSASRRPGVVADLRSHTAADRRETMVSMPEQFGAFIVRSCSDADIAALRITALHAKPAGLLTLSAEPHETASALRRLLQAVITEAEGLASLG